jgi:hypothetical protein
MTIRVKATERTLYLRGGEMLRYWEGETESGIPIEAMIMAVTCKGNEPRREELMLEFAKMMKECGSQEPMMVGGIGKRK